MKKLLFVLLSAGAYLFTACDDTETRIVRTMVNTPVFMSAEEFRNSVKLDPTPREIKEKGKICFYNGYLYISEPEVGFHIIDNRDPSSPNIVGFVELMGNVDLAIKNDILYADCYVDLVWFNITDPAKPEYTGRLANVFPTSFPQTDNYYGWGKMDYDPNEKVIVGWQLEQVSYKETYKKGEDLLYQNSGSGSGSSGINGSMARFAIWNDYLYTVLDNHLNVFNVSGDNPAQIVKHTYVGWEVETIFPYKDHLFLGTPRGLLIYSVTNPSSPEHQSYIEHIYGCDPVVVKDDIAYVTIHSGNACGQNSNLLLIIDVSDVKQPKQLYSYDMVNPKGLGVDNETLFLCDEGLKIFKTNELSEIPENLIVHYAGMNGYDVIPFDNVLMMIADEGLYQYDYSDLEKIHLISKIPFSSKE